MHTVDLNNVTDGHWNAIKASVTQQVDQTAAGYGWIVSDQCAYDKVPGVAPGRWVCRLGILKTIPNPDGTNTTIRVPRDRYASLTTGHVTLATDIDRLVNQGIYPDDLPYPPASSPPAFVILDEIGGIGGAELVARTADHIRITGLVGGRNKWGAYVVTGGGVDYKSLNTSSGVFNALLRANARIAPEFYAHQRGTENSYENNAANAANWLRGYFFGNVQGTLPTYVPTNRLLWLINQRVTLSSFSKVTPVFPVTNRFLNGTYPVAFLDYMMYIFKSGPTSVGPYSSSVVTAVKNTILPAQGGLGSWKWEQGADLVPTTGRDEVFINSYKYYFIDGNTARNPALASLPLG